MSSALSPLLPVAEAERILAAFSKDFGGEGPAEAIPLETAAGRVLREDIRADRAYPAQDRSRMDGIAVSGTDLATLASGCPVAGLARAGDARLDAPPRGACVEIMTGAALPDGCDTVVPYEDVVFKESTSLPSGTPRAVTSDRGSESALDAAPRKASAPVTARVARLRDGATARAGQFVHREGTDCAAGAVLVPAGTRLNAAQVAIAASVGMAMLRVARRPRVAVVATGDELVGVDETPLAHQLRVSNAHGLAALLSPYADTRVHRVGDDPAALAAVLRAVLSSFDMVLVSGGVSAGKFDAVPAALEGLGVKKIFHKLAQRPGKPLWFGAYDGSGARGVPVAPHTPEGLHGSPLSPEASPDEAVGERIPAPVNPPSVPVFGLPGNPVSALVCARRFVLPLLWARLGLNAAPVTLVPLGVEVEASGRLTQYLPVRLSRREVPAGAGAEVSSRFETAAEPRAVNGSGDFATLGASDGFVELPPSEKSYPAGARMAFFGWSS